MKEEKLANIIEEQISGEWGEDGDGVAVLRSTNFTNEGRLNLDNVVQRSIDKKKVEKKKLLLGDSIIEKSGGSPDQPVGRVVYFDIEEGTFLCNNFTSILRPNKEVHPRYFFWFLFYNHQLKRTLRYQNKTTGIINLQLARYLEETKIPLPSIAVQKKIADILDKADSLRQKDKQLLKLYDDLAQSVFYEIFGDPVKNDKKWAKQTLGKFGEVITGNTPSRDDRSNFSPKYIEWIKTDNIHENNLFITQASEYLSEKGLTKARTVNNGALLVTCIAGSLESLGRSALTNRRISFNQQINAIQPNDSVNSIFLYWLFKLSRKYFQDHATSGMKKIITKGEFEKIKMILPPLSTQNDFEVKVKAIQDLKDIMINAEYKSESLFQSLIQRAFNGELKPNS